MRTLPPITNNPHEAARILSGGGIIGLPTETVYGLAALADHEDAVSRIFAVKGRPRHHPLIVHLVDQGEAANWGHLDDNATRLADAYWPGPLTLLVPRTARVSLSVTGGRDTVALRVPAHPLANKVLGLLDSGVVAPSANRFGKVSPTTAEHVARDLGQDVDLVLDGGPCTVGLESTIVECAGRNIQILRPGAVTASQVMKTTGLPLLDSDTESRAPGMMLSHYAPDARVSLVGSLDEGLSLVQENEKRGIACTLLWHEDVEIYAVSLYDQLRNADLAGIETVVAVLPGRHGLGEAVRDRLLKAAAGR